MKRLLQAFGPCVMWLLAGCGIETDVAFSCDQRTKQAVCFEYEEKVAPYADMYKDDCIKKEGTFMTSGCPRTDVLGGCKADSKGFFVTVWYYRGYPEALIMKSCSDIKGTFISSP